MFDVECCHVLTPFAVDDGPMRTRWTRITANRNQSKESQDIAHHFDGTEIKALLTFN